MRRFPCIEMAVLMLATAACSPKKASTQVQNETGGFASPLRVRGAKTVVFHWTSDPAVRDAASALAKLKASAASARAGNAAATADKLLADVAYFGYGLYVAGDPYHARVIDYDNTYRTLVTFTVRGDFEATRINQPPDFATPDFGYLEKVVPVLRKPTAGIHYEYVVRNTEPIPTRSAFVLHDPALIDEGSISAFDSRQPARSWKEMSFPGDCASQEAIGRCLASLTSHFVTFADDYFLRLKDKRAAFRDVAARIPSETAIVAALRSEYLSSPKGKAAFDALTPQEKQNIPGGDFGFLSFSLDNLVNMEDGGESLLRPEELKVLTALFTNGGDLGDRNVTSAADLRAKLAARFRSDAKAVSELVKVLDYLTWLDGSLRAASLDSWLGAQR